METLLNRAIRCINFYKGFENKTTQLYYKSKILKIEDAFNLEIGKFMFKLQNNLLPISFKPYFKPAKLVHPHNTRNLDNKLFIPRINKKSGQKTLSFLGSQKWNQVSQKIKNSKSLKLFTKNYEEFLLENYK